MKKKNETYIHEATGIQFDIEYDCSITPENSYGEPRKKVRILSSPNEYKNNSGFIFNRSNPKKIVEIGKALLEIGEFCEKLS